MLQALSTSIYVRTVGALRMAEVRCEIYVLVEFSVESAFLDTRLFLR